MMRRCVLVAMLCVVVGCGVARAKGSVKPDDNSDFVSLSEYIPDVMLEIRYYSTYNFVGRRINGYEEPCALMTKKAAKALKAVSDEVTGMGYRLKIYDSYRPQKAVDHFVKWGKNLGDTIMKPYFYPERPKKVLFAEGYIARRSGHSRGSTVDLTLWNMRTGRDLDMGGTFDYFGQRSHPDFTDVTPEQLANRNLLRSVMVKHGFLPLDTEWWHFTLKSEPYPSTYFTFPVQWPK